MINSSLFGSMNPPTRLRAKLYRAPQKEEARKTVVRTPEPPAWMVKPLKPPGKVAPK